MKFFLERENFTRLIKIASTAIEKAVTNEQEGVKITGSNKASRIYAESISTYMSSKASMEANILDDFSFLVDAKMILAVLEKLKTSQIQVELGQKQLVCKGGKSTVKIPMMPQKYFPIRPDVEFLETSFFMEELKELTDGCVHALSNGDDYLMSSFHLELAEDSMRLTALDGHRMAIRNTIPQNEKVIKEFVFNGKAFMKTATLFAKEDEVQFLIPKNGNFVRFSSLNLEVDLSIIDVSYYDISKLMKNDFRKKIQVNRMELLECLELSKISSRFVKIRTRGNKLLVESFNGTSYSVSELEAKVENMEDELCMGFNVNYLIDSIKSITSKEIVLKYQNNCRPCLIKDGEESNFVVEMISPIKVNK